MFENSQAYPTFTEAVCPYFIAAIMIVRVCRLESRAKERMKLGCKRQKPKWSPPPWHRMQARV